MANAQCLFTVHSISRFLVSLFTKATSVRVVCMISSRFNCRFTTAVDLNQSNRLLLNPSKTQAIYLGRHRQLAKIDGQRLSSLFPHIAFSTCVRDLGAMLDSELTFSHHINLIARKC